MEIEDKIFEKVEELSDLGNDYIESEDYDNAIEKFNQAIELLPKPKDQWEAYAWLLASMGDAFYLKNEFQKALDLFMGSYSSEDMLDNPFVLLRIGQCFFNLEQYDSATEFLLRAYMVEGEDIFKEDLDYLKWLGTRVKL